MAETITRIQGILGTIDAAFWIDNVSLVNKQICLDDRHWAAEDGRKTLGNGSHMQ